MIKRREENYFKDFRYVTYIIGSMENPAEGDGGESKRKNIVDELIKRKIFPINPCALESHKVGMNTQQLKKKMHELKQENNWSEYRKFSRLIWKGKDILNNKNELIHIPGDFDYIRMSDWLTFILNKNDSPCGSIGEMFDAFDRDIPVYLITDIPIIDLKDSLVQAIIGSGGYIFNSENEYLHFIENEYHLV